MKLCELMRGTGVLPGPLPELEELKGLSCDSRRVEPGFAFVCIRGTAVDGHAYVRQAVENGAAVIVAEHPVELGDADGVPQVLVASGRRAWARMCANWFGNPAKRLRMIGVTGTNGKTTTTSLLKSILEANGEKVGLIGTIQNMIGERVLASGHTTPDPYDLQSMLSLMVAEGCGYAVMEVSSHALDQDRVEGCTFDAGIFTNLTQDHLDYHGTMENYLAAKKRLFSLCKTAILNQDDAWYGPMREGLECKTVTFSAGNDAADYTARNIRQRPDGVDFELVGTGVIGRVRLAVPGRFSVYNALGAAACALTLGLPFQPVVDALGKAAGVKGRCEVVPTGRDFTVVIDYAHTPDGLEKICGALRECKTGRLVTVFGCGGDRDKTKRPKMGKAAAALSDFLVVTSDNPRSEDPQAIIDDILAGLADSKTPYTVVANRVEAIRWAIHNAKSGDTILLAGKGHETYQVLRDGIVHLDEREVVAEALAQMAPAASADE